LNSIFWPGAISSPFASSRIVMTPLATAISCTSKRPASGKLPPMSRSGAEPVLVIVMKPPATFAPAGVARVQGASIISEPALTTEPAEAAP
jgi:hypothetical protein